LIKPHPEQNIPLSWTNFQVHYCGRNVAHCNTLGLALGILLVMTRESEEHCSFDCHSLSHDTMWKLEIKCRTQSWIEYLSSFRNR